MRGWGWVIAGAAGLAVLAGPAFAQDWQVVQIRGYATIAQPDGRAQTAFAGSTIAPGGSFSVSANGRAVLSDGRDTVIVSPGTTIGIPKRRVGGLATTIVQTSGQTELEIEKLSRPHFQVQTPFLAAVVKGTHFTVAVGPSGAQVSVQRGRVDVSPARGGPSTKVGPSDTATVSASGSMSVSRGNAVGQGAQALNGPGNSAAAPGKAKGKGQGDADAKGNAGKGKGNAGQGNSGKGKSGKGNSGNGNSGKSAGKGSNGNSGNHGSSSNSSSNSGKGGAMGGKSRGGGKGKSGGKGKGR